MKIAILTEGFSGTGYGHLTRCQSVYQAFEEFGFEPLFVARCDKGGRESLIGIEPLVLNWHEKQEELFDILTKTDIAVVDSYHADEVLLQKIAEVAGKAVFIDDYMRLDYPNGIIVNGTAGAETLPYRRNGKCEYLLGADYAIMRDTFRDVPEKKIKPEIDEILITMGGNDIRNLTPVVLRMLNEEYPEAKKKVIIGKGFQNIDKIELHADESTHLNYFPDAVGMLEAMLSADIAVSAAGQTLNELARTGVPTIAIGVADNQINNIEGFLSIGFLDYKLFYNEPDLNRKILSNIRFFENAKNRAAKAMAGQTAIDGKGSVRLVEYILNSIKA